ncbi:flagellar assembly peptidoglycan hydrolase FlgJ [Frateuria defendens]|uniref:flagellar assembly peptidoglycan hydrolase FlgJ n=1 Tax=Frateuria defendens TaxID=2219559 RepID=UPI0009E3D4E1|nr:flagellar assembly peptidoglycan hydrolase FlgJ [Frateuria defendens]
MASMIDSAARNVGTWTELSGFDAMRHAAQADAKSALPAVAKQFESIFTQMMLKSMREASFGDDLFGSQAGDAWRDLFDQQLSLNLSSGGRGLGIADMLVRQLGGKAGEGGAAAINAAESAGAMEADDWHRRLDSVADAARSAGRAAMSWLPQDAQQFVRDLAPYAQAAAQRLGLSIRTVLAQAALETNWGTAMPRHGDGRSSFNLFGIKAGGGWDGRRVNVPTLEFEGGVAVRRQAQFRAYESPADSFADYAELIAGSPRYAPVRGHGDDVLGFARALVDGGYATDPGYAAKIAAIANSPAMRQALAALKKGAAAPTE